MVPLVGAVQELEAVREEALRILAEVGVEAPVGTMIDAVVDFDGGGRYTLEIAPSPDPDEVTRGVVATGAVALGSLAAITLTSQSTLSTQAEQMRSLEACLAAMNHLNNRQS